MPKHTNIQLREIVINLSQQGKVSREIAKVLLIDKSTVNRIITKYKSTKSLIDKPRSGRPRKTRVPDEGTGVDRDIMVTSSKAGERPRDLGRGLSITALKPWYLDRMTGNPIGIPGGQMRGEGTPVPNPHWPGSFTAFPLKKVGPPGRLTTTGNPGR